MTEAILLHFPIHLEHAQKLMRGEDPVTWQPSNIWSQDLDVEGVVWWLINMVEDETLEPWNGGIVLAYYMPTGIIDVNRHNKGLLKHWSTVGWIPTGEYMSTEEAMAALRLIDTDTDIMPKPDVCRMELLLE